MALTLWINRRQAGGHIILKYALHFGLLGFFYATFLSEMKQRGQIISHSEVNVDIKKEKPQDSSLPEVDLDMDEIVKTTNSRISSLNEVDISEYNHKLAEHASPEKVIILSFVDMSFIDIALNFYESSLSKFEIKNYLFITNDERVCGILLEKMINCYVYVHKTTPDKAASFSSLEFNKKLSIRPYFILDALKLGFTVLHCDVDVAFFQNPITDLRSSVDSDMACLLDIGQCNAGFVYIKPTTFTVDLYTIVIKTIRVFGLDDQTALNRALESLTKRYKEVPHLNQTLDDVKYKCGVKYFEIEERHFAECAPCPQCIVVHNNWIVTKEAKRYRFREMLLWSYDTHGYYSNTSTKYIAYSNPPIASRFQKEYLAIELNALKAALYLGHILGRVVILPRFHLIKYVKSKVQISERPLNNMIKISKLDDQFFEKYRESSFFLHPKVPRKIKTDLTPLFWIKTERSIAILRDHPEAASTVTPSDKKKITTKEIFEYFGAVESAVLNFLSLYGVFGTDVIPRSPETVTFYNKLEHSFIYSHYNQL